MAVDKTIKIKLSSEMNTSKETFLINIYNRAQVVANDYLLFKKWQLDTKNYFKEEVKEKYTQYKSFGLNTILIQSTMKYVDQTIRTHITKCKKMKKWIKFPETIICPIRLRNDNFHIQQSKVSRHFPYWLRIWRKSFPLESYEYFEHGLSKSIKICDSSIVYKNNKLWLYLTIQQKAKESKETKAIGVDLGIQHPIVCSDGHIIGNGSFVKHRKIEFGKKRASQQSKGNTINVKQSNWQKDYNHKISRELIDYTISQNADVLCIEKLKGTNLSNRKFRKYSWAFSQLINFIKYKAKEYGIKVIDVNPAYTSQTCSCCGQKEKSNRKSRGKFVCNKCNHTQHADINAARNILSFSGWNGLCVLTQGA